MGNPGLQDGERTAAKPKHTDLRWSLFLPAGLFFGFMASNIVFWLNHFVLQRALFPAPRWFFEGLVPLIEKLALSGIAVATAALIAPSHRKVVGLCVSGAFLYLAVGMFVHGDISGNITWRDTAAAIGGIWGSCIGVAYAFRLAKRDLKPPDQ